MRFPWMMYCKGPGLALPNGQSVSCKSALDEKDYAEAIKAGWYPSVPEALAEKMAPAPEPVKAEEPADIAPDVKEPEDESKDEGERATPKRGRPRKS